MILYHGTNAEFGEIDLCKSKPNKDFGQGFYLSREYTQAMVMAKTKVPFWRICNLPAVSMRIFNPTKTVTSYFCHSVGELHYKCLYSLQPNFKFG
jgi:hypothetical protein